MKMIRFAGLVEEQDLELEFLIIISLKGYPKLSIPIDLKLDEFPFHQISPLG